MGIRKTLTTGAREMNKQQVIESIRRLVAQRHEDAYAHRYDDDDDEEEDEYRELPKYFEALNAAFKDQPERRR